MTDNQTLKKEKAYLRKQCLLERCKHKEMASPHIAARMAEIFFRTFVVEAKVVSGFLPIGSEINARFLLEKCGERGATICLPCVVSPSIPLVFRSWKGDDDSLISGNFGTMSPKATAPVCVPDIVLVPLLAFDNSGNRLGYGGGFFDRTLVDIREKKPIISIGIAFDSQKVPMVPVGEYDISLDYVVTEKRMYTFSGMC